ncbi:Protein O-mannosyltransferase 2 [Conglomerata obtusa]
MMKTKKERKVGSNRIRYIYIPILIFLLTYIVKSYRIEAGSSVVWDEAHFGKFSARYLKREFYFDVHPPLGKMMTALSGFVFRQDKDFKFESGTKYPENMDYVGMRRFHAFFSSFIPVFAYGITLELKYNKEQAATMALLFIFENGFGSISRLILLDSHLLFFTGCTIYFFVRFFMRKKIYDLALLGTSLGCVMSVKWIGCLTTLMIGIYTIFELWCVLMSTKRIGILFKMFFFRSLFLIFLPIFFYLLFFAIHFIICNNSTSDEAHMSSAFQATLKNGKLTNIQKYVGFGSVITIKASKISGGNLHSHSNTYPNSKHNQITTYHHKDENNHFAFQKVVEDGENADFLCDQDEVVIMHIQTKGYVAVDYNEAHISEGKRIIGVTDQIIKSCVWILEVYDDYIKKESRVKTISTRFRLKNKETNLYLNWSGKTYPEWGFKQGEVTGVTNKDKGTLWNIEENKYTGSENNEEYKDIKSLKSSFLFHVLEANNAMYISNKSLVQDKDIEPPVIVSKPYEWFILKRGLRMCGWEDTNTKFYMFGNPIIWYSSSICVILSPLILLFKYVIKKRNDKRISKLEIFEVFVYFGGWAIHYIPFFFIGRVLYFHHYFPALFFAILSINYIFKHLPRRYMRLLLILSLMTFFYFKDMTYGIVGPAQDFQEKKWITTWDFVD